MSDDKSIFSKVMEERIREIIIECLKKKDYVGESQLDIVVNKSKVEILSEIEDNHDAISDLEHENDVLQKDVEHLKSEVNDLTNNNSGIDDALAEFNDRLDEKHERIDEIQNSIEETVSSIMLKLMPEFNKKISKEVKKHFIALSEYVIKNFKEKE